MANKGHKNVIGKGFDVNPQNINKKGRPPRLVTTVLSELTEKGYKPVTKSQISDAYQFMINLDEEQLKEATLNKDNPMLFRIIAKQMLSNKGHEMIEKMLDRTHGKPTNTTNVQSDEEKPLTLRIIDTRKGNKR